MIADQHRLFVLADAAQSFGAHYTEKNVGQLAPIKTTSFYPTKPLGCYGDGGMCFTDNDSLADLMNSVKIHGKGTHKYDNARIGINGRLDAFQAAILNAKFDIFPEEVEMRDKVAKHYNQLIKESGCDLVTPNTPEGYRSVWAQYSVLAKNEQHRTDVQDKLKKEGVPSAVYYPRPLHMQTAFEILGYHSDDFPVSFNFSTRIFSLPMHPYLQKEDQEKIVRAILG